MSATIYTASIYPAVYIICVTVYHCVTQHIIYITHSAGIHSVRSILYGAQGYTAYTVPAGVRSI